MVLLLLLQPASFANELGDAIGACFWWGWPLPHSYKGVDTPLLKNPQT